MKVGQFDPLVSVIIPNYNYGNFVGEAISSVLNQTYSNIELIVVDDGSTDESKQILSKYALFAKVVFQRNAGVSSARNLGISLSKGDYICFLDADDYWYPKKIELQLELALKTKAGLVYCGYEACDERMVSYSKVFPEHRGNCKRVFSRSPGTAIVLLGTSTALISREIVEKVGHFDLSLNSSADWDYMRRVSHYTEFDFVAEALVKYRRHSRNMSSSSLRVYYSDNAIAVKKLLREHFDTSLHGRIQCKLTWLRFVFKAGKAFITNWNVPSSLISIRKKT